MSTTMTSGTDSGIVGQKRINTESGSDNSRLNSPIRHKRKYNAISPNSQTLFRVNAITSKANAVARKLYREFDLDNLKKLSENVKLTIKILERNSSRLENEVNKIQLARPNHQNIAQSSAAYDRPRRDSPSNWQTKTIPTPEELVTEMDLAFCDFEILVTQFCTQLDGVGDLKKLNLLLKTAQFAIQNLKYTSDDAIEFIERHSASVHINQDERSDTSNTSQSSEESSNQKLESFLCELEKRFGPQIVSEYKNYLNGQPK